MSCFFPPIFKKNTYKKVRFFVFSALVLGMILLFSGCNIVKGVVSAPFKAVGWGATKVSEVIKGESTTGTVKNASQSSSGPNIDGSEPGVLSNSVAEINFVPLILWGIMVVVFAGIVRSLVYKYVGRNTTE